MAAHRRGQTQLRIPAFEGLNGSHGAALGSTDKCLPRRAAWGLGERQMVPQHPWKAVSCALCSSGLILSALPNAGLQSLVWAVQPLGVWQKNSCEEGSQDAAHWILPVPSTEQLQSTEEKNLTSPYLA